MHHDPDLEIHECTECEATWLSGEGWVIARWHDDE
jgi:hypothetical protein